MAEKYVAKTELVGNDLVVIFPDEMIKKHKMKENQKININISENKDYLEIII